MIKNNLVLCFAACSLFLFSCGNKTTEGKDTASSGDNAATADEAYFTFEIDGKVQQIDAADISTSYGPDSTLKIFAGKDGELSLLLTVPHLNSCPCSVPAGAAPGNTLDQGSVSLQNFPKKPYGFNSWYVGAEGTPAADAIKVTDLGTVKGGYRYISGTFQAKVLKTETNGAIPENTDHQITNGRFRVKHDTHGSASF